MLVQDVLLGHRVLILALTVIATIVLRATLRAIFSPLRSLPGPFWARFSRMWYLRQIIRGDFHLQNQELHRKYGPIVRISPYEFSLDDPSAIKPVYGLGTNFRKSFWYDASSNPSYYTEDLFSGRDPKLHAQNRRKTANLYSMTTLLKMEEPVNECIRLLLQRLDEKAQACAPIGLQWWMQCYAFDVISIITIDKRFGYLDAGEDPIGLITTVEGGLAYSSVIGVYSELHRGLFAILNFFGSAGMASTQAFATKEIEARMAMNNDRSKGNSTGDNFLDSMLRMHAESPDKFRFDDVIGTCYGNFFAGSDTTSITLTGLLWNLIDNPAVFKKLRDEIDAMAATGEISDPIAFSEAQKLPYFQACIQEGLRTHSSVGMPLARMVPQGGATVAGQHFPEGTTLGINPWVSNFNKSVFGEDADQFRPERWMQDKETVNQMNQYLLSFGHGSRTCIGKNIALMEISKLIPTLVRRYDFRLVHPGVKPESSCTFFVKQKKFDDIVISKRPGF